ncbi:MAG: FAD-dependent oxidoreductase [Verrucomicrobiota bacterium]
MLRDTPSEIPRALHAQTLVCDLAVVGGGLAGTCCAITAARAGVKVTLIQDRPVLGGNASSEVRLWILGATSHLGNNNRWAREGGVIDEILVENLYRNPEGNPILLDALLLEKVVAEPNIQLLLNTSVHDLEKRDADTIRCVRAFCAQNSTLYEVTAPLFCDASGDGIVGFLAGAAFRIGAEANSEFGEKFAPSQPNGNLLGHTIYFYSKDTGRSVKFIPPSFALTDITKIPRFGDFTAHDSGCRLWWLEWGGQLDTVHDSETIKWELWKVVYGAWNYIKNSGKFPEADTLTLEWVGTIPGKRESRRFEGDHMLTQQDIIEQREHADAVSFGGWAIDLHPAEGVFSKEPGCTQWHAKGVYQIPYRCLYSRNIANLFLAGRIISATHIAFGSARVMATAAHNGQAVGMAAALCKWHGVAPRELAKKPYIGKLQQELLRSGQYIPGATFMDSSDLANSATLAASSEFVLGKFAPCGETHPLNNSCAMMLPLPGGAVPRIGFLLDANNDTELHAELRISSKPGNHTPDVTLKKLRISLKAGVKQRVWLDFGASIEGSRYVFFCLMANDALTLHLSDQRITGVLFVSQKFNGAVAKSPCQLPPPDIGVDSFEFWLPERRPGGKNLALLLDPPIAVFGARNLKNGVARPTDQPNAWVTSFEDSKPELTLNWPTPQTIARIELAFDPDYDHPLESVLMGHPERVTPFCIPRFEVRDDAGKSLHRCGENHQARCTINLSTPVVTTQLQFTFERPSEQIPAALYEVHCYSRFHPLTV